MIRGLARRPTVMGPKKIASTVAAVGLVATGGASTALTAPSGSVATPVLTAFTAPLDNDHRWAP